MSGHGHVTPNADGSKARCGGPALCIECAIESVQKDASQGVIFRSHRGGDGRGPMSIPIDNRTDPPTEAEWKAAEGAHERHVERVKGNPRVFARFLEYAQEIEALRANGE